VQPAPLPAPVQASAPDLARRVAIILTALLALIALRCRREPRLAVVLTQLWTYLNRAAQRFERLMARLAAGELQKPRQSDAPSSASPHPGGPHSKPALPTGRAWLIRVLGHEAAAYAYQLQTLLAEAAAAALLAEVPTAQRILRPITRMLAIGAFVLRPRPVRAAPVAAPPLEFVPTGPVAFRSQGYTWYVVPTPPA
jgi:hypothetical protein